MKRHITAKHKTVGEKNDATSEGEEGDHRCQLTSDVLIRMVNEAKQRLTDNRVFPKNVREELKDYNFTGISEETDEFKNLQDVFKCLAKKRNGEKFYSMFYSTVALRSTSYFVGLPRNAATLLSTKLADHMLSYSKKQGCTCTNSSASGAKLTEKEMAGLQYIGGYVLNKLHHKLAQSKCSRSPESQQSMSILKAGREESIDASQKLVYCLSRGGLWGITKAAEKIFLQAEKHFRSSTCNGPVLKINIEKIRSESSSDLEVKAAYGTLLLNSELRIDKHVAKDVLQSILDLYFRVRSFSYGKDIVQNYKIKTKRLKEKGLRKEISRASKESNQERQP